MNFPAGFDSSKVTKVHLNECYFHTDEAYDEALRVCQDTFPNAETPTYVFHEDPSQGVLTISAEPPLSTGTLLILIDEFGKLISPGELKVDAADPKGTAESY